MRYIKNIWILLFFCFYGCSKMNPANFWEEFDADNIVSSEGDFQGRYGYKIVHFKREKGSYEISNILSFAKQNGWNLYNEKKYIEEDFASWNENSKLLFKPGITGFKSTQIKDKFIKVFPRYIDTNFTVYEFDTEGMVLVNSDTNSSSQRVGFIVLSEDKSIMTVYHLWGETNRHEIDDSDDLGGQVR